MPKSHPNKSRSRRKVVQIVKTTDARQDIVYPQAPKLCGATRPGCSPCSLPFGHDQSCRHVADVPFPTRMTKACLRHASRGYLPCSRDHGHLGPCAHMPSGYARERVCVHCGCSDDHACAGGCAWAVVHHATRTGVCTNCITAELRALFKLGLQLANHLDGPRTAYQTPTR